MKTLKLISISILLFIGSVMHAQVSVNVNIGSPPLWGPVGYEDVRYYYLPDVEAYYDIHTSMFIYLSDGAWIHRTYLPYQFRHYDLYSGYKVVLSDYHGDRPHIFFHNHKTKYGKGYRGKPQKTIGSKSGKGNQSVGSPAKKVGPSGKAVKIEGGRNKQSSGGKNKMTAPHGKGNKKK